MKRYYYSDRFKTDGNVLGPVSIEELEQLYIKQEITEKCLVCIEGTEEWQSFIEVLKKFNEQKRDLKNKKGAKKQEKLKECVLLAIIGIVFLPICGYGGYNLLKAVSAAPKFIKDAVSDAKFIMEESVISTDDSSSSLIGKNIIGVEKVTTESRVKPSIGIIGGRKPRTGIVGTYERGSTKYKVTYEDDNGIIRTETLNKDPTKD